jgi:hypothetical protein
MFKSAPLLVAVVAASTWLSAAPAGAQESVVTLAVKGHQFQPSEIHAPANTRIVLKISNLDAAAMEFESVSLRVEKVIAANGEGIVNLRPLQPGRYNFFDDFNPQTRGTLVVP